MNANATPSNPKRIVWRIATLLLLADAGRG